MAVSTNLKSLQIKANGKITERKVFSNDDASVALADLAGNQAEVQRQLRLLVSDIADDDTNDAIVEKIDDMVAEKAELIDVVNDVMYTDFTHDASFVELSEKIADTQSRPYRLAEGVVFENADIEIMPVIDTSDIVSMRYMFAGCTKLVSFSQSRLKTDHITDMYRMFESCSALKSIPSIDISNLASGSIYNMLHNCSALEEITFTGIWQLTGFSQLSGLKNLRVVKMGDTRNFTSMSSMFYDCYALESVPPMDTSNVTKMRSMFGYCYALDCVPPMDTSNVTDMYYMFNYFGGTRIEQIDVTSLTEATNMLRVKGEYVSNVYKSNLQYLKILNFGTTDTTIDFQYLSDWGVNYGENKQSLIDTLLTYSCDRAAAGKSAMTVKLHKSVYNRLSYSERAAIIAKGYTLTY